MQRIKFREWEFIVDKQQTLDTYSNISLGGPERCNCNYCKNFIANREQLYPDEIRKLLIDLGVDYTKEYEVFHYNIDPDDNHIYGGWFNFKGLLIGKEIPYTESNYTIVTTNFSIWLGNCKENAGSFFEVKNDNLVEVDFIVKIPWVHKQGFRNPIKVYGPVFFRFVNF